MSMIRFECDYGEGAHPAILKRLMETNLEQTRGYGIDPYCDSAREKIRKACNCEDADVHFLVGGTQANMTVISSILRPHQGVLCAETGHINVHETGAVEATGHKVLALPATNGKITAEQIRKAWTIHHNDADYEHIVQPGMVYISWPTETGTLYSKAELSAIHRVCKETGLPLFLDGARMGYGLASPENDLTLEDLAALCDVFYIGGTKVGALFGEAVVITNPALKQDFRYFIKQKGGMLAKGRLLGIQFDTLFTDGLYEALGEHAVGLALQIRQAFREKGNDFMVESPTNQQFPILTQEQYDALKEKYSFALWGALDDGRYAVRFCTSWASKESDVRALIEDIQRL